MDNLHNTLNYTPNFNKNDAPYTYTLIMLAREKTAAINNLHYYTNIKPHTFNTPLTTRQLTTTLALYNNQTHADTIFTRTARLMTTQETKSHI